MAPKRSRLVEEPLAPARSSSTSEEEEDKKNKEDKDTTPEESSEEEEDGQKNKSPPPAVDKEVSSDKHSSSEEEDGSDSESDPQSGANIKPMEETPARSKAGASITPSPVKPSTSKRPRKMGLENKEAKRAKKEEEQGEKKIGEDSKKQMFQRIWTEEDELVFLRAIADYSAKHGCVPYPNGDMNEFHDSVRNSLHCEFSRGQLTDKIRRLKKKYVNNVSRAKFGEEDPTFRKRDPHELKAFELSKKIWGVFEGSSSQQSRKGKNQKLKVKAVMKGDVKEAVMPANEPESEPARKPSSIVSDLARLNESVGLPPILDQAVEIGLGLLSQSVMADLEGRWEEIQEEEFRLYLKKVELIQKQVKAAMHAFRSRNH